VTTTLEKTNDNYVIDPRRELVILSLTASFPMDGCFTQLKENHLGRPTGDFE